MKKLLKTAGILFGWLALSRGRFAGDRATNIMKYEWTAFPAMVTGVMLLVCGLIASGHPAEKIWEQKDVGSASLGFWGFRQKFQK